MRKDGATPTEQLIFRTIIPDIVVCPVKSDISIPETLLVTIESDSGKVKYFHLIFIFDLLG